MSLQEIVSLFKQHPIEFSSLIVAILAAFFAWRSMVIAKKAYRIAVDDHNSKQPNFDIYLIDSFRETSKIEHDPVSLILINMTIYNKSQSSSSFHSVLNLTYIDQSDKAGVIELIHDPALLIYVSSNQIEVFPTDINVGGKNSESKWLIFKEPIQLVKRYRIKKYTVIMSDINQTFRTNEIFIIKDLIHENRK